MDKKFRGKLLLLGCLVLAIIPSLVYADYYAMLKVETYPVLGSTDVTKGVDFAIRVIACNEDGNPITGDTDYWDYAQTADIVFGSLSALDAEIWSDGSWWVLLEGHETNLQGEGVGIFYVRLHTVGDRREIEVKQNTRYGYSFVQAGYLYFKVHDFVHYFEITILDGHPIAGVPFNIRIVARDGSEKIAETFKDNVYIEAVIPDYPYAPFMDRFRIDKSAFTDGVAGVSVEIYGSHPENREVQIKCFNGTEHGGFYATGESDIFHLYPDSYAKILLRVPGEEHIPGRPDPYAGKEGTPELRKAGELFKVWVYTTDAYWNPVSTITSITFSSSDPDAQIENDSGDLVPLAGYTATVTESPQEFTVRFRSIDQSFGLVGEHSITITEGSKMSQSTDIPVEPNDANRFVFDSEIPNQRTTRSFRIDITAYDEYDNIADYNGQDVLLTCSPISDRYLSPDSIDFNGGRGNADVQVTLPDLVKIIVDDGLRRGESNEFFVFSGEFNQLLVLLDGETHTPGLEPGRDYEPRSIVAGSTTTVTIMACDDTWNKKRRNVSITNIYSETGYVELIDPPAGLPFNLGSDGIRECVVRFRTAYDVALRREEPQTITFIGDGITGTSSSITVYPGPFERLVLVAPEEQLNPGTLDPDGKMDKPPISQVAGEPFTLRVTATDKYWNPVESGFRPYVYFHTDDPATTGVQLAGESRVSYWTYAGMPTAIEDFPDNILITLDDSGQLVKVRGYTTTTPVVSKEDEVYIPVTHGDLHHFAFDFDIPVNYIAGNTISNVTITAQDKLNYTVESFNQIPTLTVISTTGEDMENTFEYINPTFVDNGVFEVDVRIYRAIHEGESNVKFKCIWEDVESDSDAFKVYPGNYEKLILRLPGETLRPGDERYMLRGKSGIPSDYTVSDPAFESEVYAVDKYWNEVDPPAPEPTVEIKTEPGHYLDVDGDAHTRIEGGMIGGRATFSTMLRTAADAQTLVVSDKNRAAILHSSSTIKVNPGPFVQLQILALEEIPDPGSNQGKTGPVIYQVASVDFNLIVRAVDVYYNRVNENGHRIDLKSVQDSLLDDRFPYQPFEAGVTTFTIWLAGNNEYIDVIAYADEPDPPTSDQVNIYVEKKYEYVVDVPTFCTAGVGFPMTVKLIDPTIEPPNDQVVRSANNEFQMTACLTEPYPYPDAPEPEALHVRSHQLRDGEAFFDQTYDIVREIRIKVSDEFGREPVDSSVIDVRPNGPLKYKVDVPDEDIVARADFEMTVSLIDIGTGRIVPTERQVNLEPVSYAEPGEEGILKVTTGGLSQGEWRIRKQYYTKAETIYIKASETGAYEPPAEESNLEPRENITFLAGAPMNLQILAPGEIAREGRESTTGKDSKDIISQKPEIPFDVEVRVVDRFWNVVEELNGEPDYGTLYLTSEGSFSCNPDTSSVTGGKATFRVTVHQAGPSFTLKAEAEDPPGLSPQEVTIPMKVAEYQIEALVEEATTEAGIPLEIKLVDPDNPETPLNDATNRFNLIAVCPVDDTQAPGKWMEVREAELQLERGEADLLVNYDTVGTIRFKVSDDHGSRAARTSDIKILPAGLEYEVGAPKEVEAGKEFRLTVRLIDSVRKTLVTPKEYNRYVELVARSSPDGNLAEGILKGNKLLEGNKFLLEGGTRTILVSYSLAHDIYIEASDAQTYAYPVTSEPPDRTADIEVIGVPKTVMKFDGVYSEMNGALYLRGSTLVKIECISEIKTKYIYYRDNGGDWKKCVEYVEPFTLSPGAHVIEYYGEDNYEHAEQVNKSKTIYVSFFGEGVDGVSNQPNPFKAGREKTLIVYNLKQPSNVTITIYDLLGQEVWHKSYRAGEDGGKKASQVRWDGRNLSGKVVANGGYICRIWIEKERRHMVRKIAVAK